MKFSDDNARFEPFTVTIETAEEAVVLLNVLSSYSSASMKKMAGNVYYSSRVRAYSDMHYNDIGKVTTPFTKQLRDRLG